MENKIIRSPLFYVGDKYRLMKQLRGLFPKTINNYFEPFVGGGTVFLNIEAKKYYLNDIDKNLINILKCLIENSNNPDTFFRSAEEIIYKFNLSRSYKEDIVPDSLKIRFKKTYFAKFNKTGYEKLRTSVNLSNDNDPLTLYILLIYGFNRMLRFNGGGRFNLPVGNVDFNKNVVRALNDFFNVVRSKEIKLSSKDFRSFILGKSYSKNDFVYFDPPYLITSSEYNKLWNEKSERDLFTIIDNLSNNGVKFAFSNVTHYNDRKNELLIEWMKKYRIHEIESNYINYHNNSKKQMREILVTNY